MSLTELTYRRVDLKSDVELRQIAEIDMSIPPLYDKSFPYNEKMITDRIKHFKESTKEDDFFELALDSQNHLIGFHIVNIQVGFNELRVGRIDTLWVRPENRKQGVAKKLKNRAELWAKSQKLEYFFTWVQAANKNMFEFNQKLGFEIVNYKMQKKIDY